jgi:hypothetical protein
MSLSLLSSSSSALVLKATLLVSFATFDFGVCSERFHQGNISQL